MRLTGELRSERWAGRQDGATSVESNYKFPTFLAGPRGCIEDVFAEVEFKCRLAVEIGRFEFEQDGKREVVVRRGIRVAAKEIIWGRILRFLLENY